MTTDVIYEERGSDWSHQVSVVATTRWLQYDQTLAPSAKGVACETTPLLGASVYLLQISQTVCCSLASQTHFHKKWIWLARLSRSLHIDLI